MASRATTDPIEILLEMGVDLDNLSEEEDYLSALMEAVNTLTIKDASDPRIGFLADEIRKVREKRKAADPKFKAKKTKISADSFKKGSATTASIGQKALPPTNIQPKTSIIPYVKPEEVDEEEEGGKKKKARTRKTDKDQKLLEKIAKSVSNIADILKEQYGLKKKKASYDRKKAEADKRKLKESNLEKSFKGLASAAEKIIAPVKGALDSIFDFFLNIIIGRFLVKFIGWFGDPKNKEKVDSVVRFLVDHGPKLLAAFLLFGTSIGRFAVRLSAMLLKGALRLGAAAAKFALRFAMRNPAAAAITAIVGGAALGAVSQANTQSNDPDAPEGRTQLEDTMDFGGVTGDPMAGAFQYGGTIPYYNDGGGVGSGKITTNSGSDITGAGPDTQLIAAQPGEVVINKRTVDAVGADHFLGLNQQYGGPGANKPKTATVQTASDGGIVLPAFSAGGYVSGTDTGKRGTPDPEKEESSGGASPSLGYRLGQVNPMMDLRVMENVDEKVYDKQRRRGQGGRLVGSTTQRKGEGTKIYKDGHLVTSYDKYGRKKEYGKPEGFMRALAGLGDILTGNLFDFDRRNKGNVGISESRIVTKEFAGGRALTDDTTTSQIMSAIARSDLIKHQDQILKQLPKGNTIENVISGDIFRGIGQGGKELGSTTRRGGSNITPEKLARILATSDAQEATRKKQDRARRLDEAIRGIDPNDPNASYSMSAGDMTPALQQAEATANKRHAELMKSTDPERIAAYDKQHGQGAYSQKLKEKLYRTYGGQATGQNSGFGNLYYKNYTEALKDPKVAAAAQVEKTKAKLSLAVTPPKVTPPPPPSFEPKVNVISAPAQQGSDSVPTGNGSGSEVDARPTGNGNANKFKIFGISLPF